MAKPIYPTHLSLKTDSKSVNSLPINSVSGLPITADDDFCQELGAVLKKQHQNHCNLNEQPLHSFARYLRAARQNALLTPSALAEMVGDSEATIYALEHAMLPPCEIEFSLLQDIAAVLDEDVHLFLLLLERTDSLDHQRSWLASFQGFVSHLGLGRLSSMALLWIGLIWQGFNRVWTMIPQNNGYYLRACSGAVGVLCMFMVFYMGSPITDSLNGFNGVVFGHYSLFEDAQITEPPAAHRASIQRKRRYEIVYPGNAGNIENLIGIPIDQRRVAIFSPQKQRLKGVTACDETGSIQTGPTQHVLCPA